ncbi:zinc ribbon domain-containing protein [Pseudomonas luteola]|uniref:zinc ribbon domain-containing protein n=1 Tax=Pseudomonas luteola TaxID=47886 RepID=UPI0030B8CFE2
MHMGRPAIELNEFRFKVRADTTENSFWREAYTTRVCSACGSLVGPQGVNGLRIKEWTCCECGVAHDRDINAARNILALGHERPSVGIPVL